MPLDLRKVEVYLFRRSGGRVRFLALRRSPGRKLPGVWQPVTGKRRAGERMIAAAVREVREETGLRPRRWWLLETATLYVDPERDALVVLPVFAAEIPQGARVRLSEEHDAHRFVTATEAARLYLWQSQRQALGAVRRQVLAGGELARALLVSPTAVSNPGRAARRREPKGPRRAGALR